MNPRMIAHKALAVVDHDHTVSFFCRRHNRARIFGVGHFVPNAGVARTEKPRANDAKTKFGHGERNYPLSAPIRTPSRKYFWNRRKKITIGSAASAAPEKMMPQSVINSPCRLATP